ncbi:acyltransferase [Scytonema hofmannii PCC 7110]|uniref:Acyltransferase n=1 Tax=Scytonema hofmannii PCC 7110 TaxID=128403 RepID=A0A139WWC0_9CYAN|nr:acyltransferase [Scytonema hofmannii]KYC36734.1 acyltransferase [Scytonema hofmannii PCC 7110]
MQIFKSNNFTEQRLRLQYLDGLRGLASLYVVLVHIDPFTGEQLPEWLSLFTKLLRYGAFSVVVFIVLSGYVLMLPVVRSQTGFVSGGLLNYIQRRSRRILPPYYTALVLSLLLAVAVVAIEKFTNFRWTEIPEAPFSPYFAWVDVVTHLLLIHNFSSDTYHSINSPMWSVATEWQLYFLFPLLLLPIWRRFGITVVVIAAFLIGLAPLYLFNRFIETACPWFLGIFALGMLAADVGFSQNPKLINLKKSIPWGMLAVILTLIAFVTEWRRLGLEFWVGQSFLGAASACLFICFTQLVVEEKKSPLLLRLFEHPWAIALGAFSYSLYLTHGPVLMLVRQVLLSWQMSPTMFGVTYYILSTVMSLLFAYLFYLFVERPFMSHFLKKRKVKDAVSS